MNSAIPYINVDLSLALPHIHKADDALRQMHEQKHGLFTAIQ